MAITGGLAAAEQRLLGAFPTGRLEEFGTGDAEHGDPAGGEAWGQHRQVRAKVLAELLCGAVAVKPGQVGEVYLDRVRVIGKLELQGGTLKHGLRLHNCYVPEGIDLSEATAQTIELQGCHVGAIRLDRAKINGVFILSGAHLDGKGGPALTAENLTVTTSMICDKGFRAHGRVDLNGASIGGFLTFSGAYLDGKGGPALTVQSLTVTTSMICDREFRAQGQVDLHGASIGSQLAFRGAHLNGNNRPALAPLKPGREVVAAPGRGQERT
jgi:hypothetical protein